MIRKIEKTTPKLLLLFLFILGTTKVLFSQADAGPDKCIGKDNTSGVVIGGNGGTSWCYSWEPTAGLSDPHILHPTAKPSITTTYTLTVVGPDFDFISKDDMVVTVCDQEKIKLGAKKSMTSKSGFKVFVPTRWGGKLNITTTNGTITELKYPDGSDYSNGTETGTDKQGWYTFKVCDADNYTVTTEFLQKGEASKRPWNFYWWSTIPGATTLYSVPGPLSKYDAYFGTNARYWEEANDNSSVSYSGHCLGLACASILLNQPTAIPTFHATNDEVEGLWGELGEDEHNPNYDEAFGNCPAGPPTTGFDGTDPYAGKFHRMMEQYVKGSGEALQSNLRESNTSNYGPTAIWNHAVWKYEAKYEEAPGDNENKVKITITVYANADHPLPTDDLDNRVINYVYIIEYSGGLVNEMSIYCDWISVSGQAKWTPYNLIHLTGMRWEGHNKQVTESNVRKIDSANH